MTPSYQSRDAQLARPRTGDHGDSGRKPEDNGQWRTSNQNDGAEGMLTKVAGYSLPGMTDKTEAKTVVSTTAQRLTAGDIIVTGKNQSRVAQVSKDSAGVRLVLTDISGDNRAVVYQPGRKVNIVSTGYKRKPKYTGRRVNVLLSRRGTVPAAAAIIGMTPDYLDKVQGIAYTAHETAEWPQDGTTYVKSYRVTGDLDALQRFAGPRGIDCQWIAATPEQEHALNEISKYAAMRQDLDAKRIAPRSVVGTGYKNSRKAAEDYTDLMIETNIAIVELTPAV